jgi:glycosyltransferase involved in cell wall biosynthesis
MTNWLFVGPTSLSGIGQVTARYARLMGGEFVVAGDTPQKAHYDRGFIFVLPLQPFIDVCAHYAQICDSMMYMTICETDTVHEDYGKLSALSKTLYTPSEFCKNILQKQFPELTFKVVHLWADPEPLPREPVFGLIHTDAFTFYTIGNVMDFRKNLGMLVEAFVRCEFPPGSARILLKATCREPVQTSAPFVTIINELLTDGQMEAVHEAGDCYVNCSHSEGVGMGAVEAALRSKPVIITDYGGLKEYVRTPYVIKCTPCTVGKDDFLFHKEMTWGQPNIEELIMFMKHAYYNKDTPHLAEKGFTAGLVAAVPSEFNQ